MGRKRRTSALSVLLLVLLSTCTTVQRPARSSAPLSVMITVPSEAPAVRGYELRNLTSMLGEIITEDFRSNIGEVDLQSSGSDTQRITTISVVVVRGDQWLPSNIQTLSADDPQVPITWFSLEYVVRAASGEVTKRGVVRAEGSDPASYRSFDEQQRLVTRDVVIKLRNAILPALGS